MKQNEVEFEIGASKVAQPKRGRGRPATITMAVIEQVAKLIAKGMPEPLACARVGISHDSFRTARHRNPEFETAVKERQAEFVDTALDRIAKGERGWQGAAWVLERRHPEFRRNMGLEVSEKPVDEMTDAELEQLILSGCSPEDLKHIHELGLVAFLEEQRKQQESGPGLTPAAK